MTIRAMAFKEGQAVAHSALEFEVIPRVGEYVALLNSTDVPVEVTSVVLLPGVDGNTPSIRVNVRAKTPV